MLGYLDNFSDDQKIIANIIIARRNQKEIWKKCCKSKCCKNTLGPSISNQVMQSLVTRCSRRTKFPEWLMARSALHARCSGYRQEATCHKFLPVLHSSRRRVQAKALSISAQTDATTSPEDISRTHQELLICVSLMHRWKGKKPQFKGLKKKKDSDR